jgi:hypothetical protein
MDEELSPSDSLRNKISYNTFTPLSKLVGVQIIDGEVTPYEDVTPVA